MEAPAHTKRKSNCLYKRVSQISHHGLDANAITRRNCWAVFDAHEAVSVTAWWGGKHSQLSPVKSYMVAQINYSLVLSKLTFEKMSPMHVKRALEICH